MQVKKDLSGNIKVTNNTITVKGLKLGKATIVVETSKEKRAISYITVHQEPTSIELSATSEILDISSVIKSLQIKPTIYPSTANASIGLRWEIESSSSPNVISISSNGVVTGLSNGTATVRVTTENNKTATGFVTVQTSPESISISPSIEKFDIRTKNKSIQ